MTLLVEFPQQGVKFLSKVVDLALLLLVYFLLELLLELLLLFLFSQLFFKVIDAVVIFEHLECKLCTTILALVVSFRAIIGLMLSNLASFYHLAATK